MQLIRDHLKLFSLAMLAGVAAFALTTLGSTYLVGYIEIALIAFSFQMPPKGKFWKYVALAIVILALNLSEASFIVLYRSHKLRREWHEGASPPEFYFYSTLLIMAVQNTVGCLIHFLCARTLLHVGTNAFRPFVSSGAQSKARFTFSVRSMLTAMTLIAVLCVFPTPKFRTWSLQFVSSDIVMSVVITLYCVGIIYLGTRLSTVWRNVLLLPIPQFLLLFMFDCFPSLQYYFNRIPMSQSIELQLGAITSVAIFVQAAWAWIEVLNIKTGIKDAKDNRETNEDFAYEPI